MKLNLPNKLTLMRVILVPVFMFFIIFPVAGKTVSPLIALGIFIIASLTDMLDGKIARKRGLITDFGKFLDPLADKLLVIGGIVTILYKRSLDCAVDDLNEKLFCHIFVWVTFIVILRELAVTSMRLVVSSSSGKVIAAGQLGKIKTVTQMITIMVLLVEPVLPALFGVDTHNAVSYFCMGIMAIMTVWSGVDYMRSYLPEMDANK